MTPDQGLEPVALQIAGSDARNRHAMPFTRLHGRFTRCRSVRVLRDSRAIEIRPVSDGDCRKVGSCRALSCRSIGHSAVALSLHGCRLLWNPRFTRKSRGASRRDLQSKRDSPLENPGRTVAWAALPSLRTRVELSKKIMMGNAQLRIVAETHTECGRNEGLGFAFLAGASKTSDCSRRPCRRRITQKRKRQ